MPSPKVWAVIHGALCVANMVIYVRTGFTVSLIGAAVAGTMSVLNLLRS